VIASNNRTLNATVAWLVSRRLRRRGNSTQ